MWKTGKNVHILNKSFDSFDHYGIAIDTLYKVRIVRNLFE